MLSVIGIKPTFDLYKAKVNHLVIFEYNLVQLSATICSQSLYSKYFDIVDQEEALRFLCGYKREQQFYSNTFQHS